MRFRNFGALPLSAALLLGALAPLSSALIAPGPAAADPPPFIAEVNFQNQFGPVPSGYVADSGFGYDAGRGYGWVQPNTLTPVSMVANGKDRNRVLDRRLDSVMVVKGTAPNQWVLAVPDGTYDVTVSVGDYQLAGNSRVVVNGTTLINSFKSTQQQLFTRATVRVDITGGYLRLDAAPNTGLSANSRWNYVDVAQVVGAGPHQFTSMDPVAGSDAVPVTTSVTLTTSDSVDALTIAPENIQLLDPHGAPVAGFFNTDAAGGVINFTPSNRLAAFTVYSFQTTDGLRGLDGVPFAELTASFETDDNGVPQSPTSFNRVTFDTMVGPTVIQKGPDGRLYVANAIGEIRRYDIDPTTGLPSAAPLVVNTYLYQSTILGIAFSGSTSDPDVWVSRSVLGDEQPDFTGSISVLTGANLDTSRDVIVGLPRSFHDHQNNAIHFGPDGKLYIAQGAQTGYGAPDAYWGMRSETPLSAAILVADVLNDPAFQTTFNADTSLGYDPSAVGAPLTAHATGVRNPYDFVFASNGHMYAPVNESASGNTPAGPGDNPPALSYVPAGNDMFDDIIPGGYYGHPNPSIGHYTLNGGNPTGALTNWAVPQYPVGTQPDPGWIAPMYNLGPHRSANGIAEYTSSQFNNTLKGQLLVAEFSAGKDVIALKLDATGTSVINVTQLASGFDNPLAVATDLTGRIYVSEYGAQPYGTGGQITLLQPTPGVATAPYARINFQSQSATIPTGYQRDFGEAFNTETNYGWINQNDTDPVSLIGNGVKRNAAVDQRLNTYMAMQYNGTPIGGVLIDGRWQMAVPNGTYNLTASVGDASRIDSVNQLAANGTVLINQFHPTGSNHFASGSAQIEVTDGMIVLDSAGGTNTKINYVNIDHVTFIAPDNNPPVITTTPSGTLNTDGTSYVGSVVVAVDATDAEGPVSSISYRIDGGAFQTPYTAPITITGEGPHTLTVNAIDAAGNLATDVSNYVIDSVVPYAGFSSPDDFLGTGTRLVFSTVANDLTRPSRSMFITNPSPKDLVVTNLSTSGTNGADFAIVNPPTMPFTILPGGQQQVDIAFQPIDTATEQYASFDVTTNNPVQPVFSATLTGANAPGFEGSLEPSLKNIGRVFGFTDQIPDQPGQTRLPSSVDEIVSPYWVAADSGQPVDLKPLAHYATRSTGPTILTGWTLQSAPKVTNTLYSFPGGSDSYGGANQQLLPAITGTTSFSPGTAPFGLVANAAYSEDFNNSSLRLHNVRFFQAKRPDGTVIPHTWFVGVDIGNNITTKNYDYQDAVMLLTNADPQFSGAPLPGASSLNLDFANIYPSTVADMNGNGTGFSFVMPNTAGTQYDPSLINLNTGAGTLDLTSTAGTMTAKANTQLNALGLNFDASRAKFTVKSRLVGPFTQINNAHQHQALYYGVDQNNFLKVEVENNAGTPGLVVFFEQVTPTGAIPNKIIAGPISPATLANAGFVDVYMTCDPALGSCTFAYRIDSELPGDITPLGTSIAPKYPMKWFGRNVAAGVLVSNQKGTIPIVGRFQTFGIIPAP